MMLELQEWGCHNINFVTPEHVVPQILAALPHAIDAGLCLPIVYNTSAYDSLDSLELMDGVVDIYMPDVKVWSRERGRRYLRMPGYADVMRAALAYDLGLRRLDRRSLASGFALAEGLQPHLDPDCPSHHSRLSADGSGSNHPATSRAPSVLRWPGTAA